MHVVVISKSYEAALGIGRSLKAAGHEEIELIFVGSKNAFIVMESNVFSKKSVINARNEQEIVDKLAEAHKASGSSEKWVLFPADDYTTSVADRYRTRLEPMYRYTYVEGHAEGAITHLMDKAVQTGYAAQFDLRMAASNVASFNGTRFVVPAGVTYPCFVKPLVSANGAAKANMARCQDADALEKHLDKLVKKGATEDVLVQEFIEIEEEFNIHGICDGDRLFLPIIHKKEATGHYTKGVTVLGKNLDPAVLEPHLSKLKALLLSLGYHGIFNVEMFRSKGNTYLNEINVRIAGTCWGAAGAGANLPALWVRCLTEENMAWPTWQVKYNSVFINDKTAYEDYITGYCTKAEFKSWNQRAEFHLIKNDQDPGPWKAFRKMMRKKQMKKLIAKLLHRK